MRAMLAGCQVLTGVQVFRRTVPLVSVMIRARASDGRQLRFQTLDLRAWFVTSKRDNSSPLPPPQFYNQMFLKANSSVSSLSTPSKWFVMLFSPPPSSVECNAYRHRDVERTYDTEGT